MRKSTKVNLIFYIKCNKISLLVKTKFIALKILIYQMEGTTLLYILFLLFILWIIWGFVYTYCSCFYFSVCYMKLFILDTSSGLYTLLY